MKIMSLNKLKYVIATGVFMEISVWQWIFLYTQLYVFRRIEDDERMIVGIVECLLAFTCVGVMRNNAILDWVKRSILGFQIVSFLLSVVSRFLVMITPGGYMLITYVHQSTLGRIIWSALEDMENFLYQEKEKTDLTLLREQSELLGAVVGSTVGWITTGVEIITLMWAAVFALIPSFIWEIWLTCTLKRFCELKKEGKLQNSASNYA